MHFALTEADIDTVRDGERFIILGDVPVVAEDAAQIIRATYPGAEVVLCASLPLALDALRARATPSAVLMIDPRLPLAGHPLVEAAEARGARVVVMSDDDPLPGTEARKILGVTLPFTQHSLEAVISQVVRDRSPG